MKTPYKPLPESKLNSAEYRSGHQEGCPHATNGLLRNFTSDTAHRDEWFKGNADCHPQLDALQSKGDPNRQLKNLF